MRHDVSVTVHDEHHAVAHARIANTLEQTVDRNYGRKHSRELPVLRERQRNDQRRTIVFAERDRLAHEVQSLNARRERALQRHLHERIKIGRKTSRGLTLGLLVHRRNVKNVRIVFDEALQQSRELRSLLRVIDVLNPTRQRKNLPLTQKLFAKILFELKCFARERPGDLALLQTLGVLQFLFAEPQHLPVV